MDGIIPRGWAPWLLSVLRIVAGALFILHGTQKLFGWPTSATAPAIVVPLMSIYGLAAILEIVGGGLVVLGLFTRIVALILAGEMAIAYVMAHAPLGPWPTVNGGELAVLYCFIFLYLAAAGGGPLSLGARR